MENKFKDSLFINSEQVGDVVSVALPGFDGGEETANIHYLESGVGEPLLLIHGLGQSLYTWRSVFAELSENYRVIAIDLLGHGFSSRPESFNYSPDAVAGSIKAFMDAKAIESAHMIGFSFGAMYMLRFLSLYPDMVANCIAISPGGVTNRMPKLVHRVKNPFFSVFARNLFSAGDVEKLLKECVYDPSIVDEHMIRQYYLPISDGLSREGLMYALENLHMEQIAQGLQDVDHEVLVLWGKEDRWHPASGSVYFQGVLQSGRYYMIRGAGHLLQEENPEKLMELIFSYIPPAHPNYRVYEYTSREPAGEREEDVENMELGPDDDREI